MGRDSRRRCWPAESGHSPPSGMTAPDWDWRSSSASPTSLAAICASPTASPMAPLSPSCCPAMTETLLLIEDEPLLSAELQRHFRREGWDVHVAPSLAKARRALDEDDLQPLVVVSDMNMPDGNALDLLESSR